MATLDQIKKLIGQRMIVGFDGTKLPSELKRLDEEWGLGGYIMFKRNFTDFEQLLSLNEELWARGQGTPPFIAVDHEGGQVPSPRALYRVSRYGAYGSSQLCIGGIRGGRSSGGSYRNGIQPLAPVLDLNTNPDNPIIGRRAISPDPEKVS